MMSLGQIVRQSYKHRWRLHAIIAGGAMVVWLEFLNLLGNLPPVAWWRRWQVARFNRLYYLLRRSTFDDTRFMGKHLLKFPTDLWSYQEILFEKRPDVIVETGVFLGGSTYYFATLQKLLGAGRVIAVDITLDHADHDLAEMDNVTLIEGDSSAEDTRAKIAALIGPGESVMVILDSNHTEKHVLEEMRQLAPLVTEGQYLVVEDGLIDQVYPLFSRRGPLAAIRHFLRERPDFHADLRRNRFLLSQNPNGYLLRGELPSESPANANSLVRPLKMWMPGFPFRNPIWFQRLNQNRRRP
jgi:cephalosporin hydroxylase